MVSDFKNIILKSAEDALGKQGFLVKALNLSKCSTSSSFLYTKDTSDVLQKQKF